VAEDPEDPALFLPRSSHRLIIYIRNKQAFIKMNGKKARANPFESRSMG
jgi:hypothetical protein